MNADEAKIMTIIAGESFLTEAGEFIDPRNVDVMLDDGKVIGYLVRDTGRVYDLDHIVHFRAAG